ncbi:MAG: hypothetical protein H6712_06760 [Myxococcales bacterium]|nr:hypothetical protein [Myxococcales bacterium]MCB9713534.1 hypothetical protein [Myxococcales bacterium]
MNDHDETPETIELIDIDDLRTAFGGEGVELESDTASAAPGDTIMCSGWAVN